MAIIKHALLPIRSPNPASRKLLRTVNIGQLEERVTGVPFLDTKRDDQGELTRRPLLKWKHNTDLPEFGPCGSCLWKPKGEFLLGMDVNFHMPCPGAHTCNTVAGCSSQGFFCILDNSSAPYGLGELIRDSFFQSAFAIGQAKLWTHDLWDCAFDAGSGVTSELHYRTALYEDIPDDTPMPLDPDKWRYIAQWQTNPDPLSLQHWWVAVDNTDIDITFDWANQRVGLQYLRRWTVFNSDNNPPTIDAQGRPEGSWWTARMRDRGMGAPDWKEGTLPAVPDCVAAWESLRQEFWFLDWTQPLFRYAKFFLRPSGTSFGAQFIFSFNDLVDTQPDKTYVQVPFLRDFEPFPAVQKGHVLRAKSIGPGISICGGLTFANAYSIGFSSTIIPCESPPIGNCNPQVDLTSGWILANVFSGHTVVRTDPSQELDPNVCSWHTNPFPLNNVYLQNLPFPVTPTPPPLPQLTLWAYPVVASMVYVRNIQTLAFTVGWAGFKDGDPGTVPNNISQMLGIATTQQTRVIWFHRFAPPPNGNCVALPRGTWPIIEFPFEDRTEGWTSGWGRDPTANTGGVNTTNVTIS